jgi:hypothetical protein
VVLLSVLPGGILDFLPYGIRVDFAYVFVAAMGLAFGLLAPQISGAVTSTLGASIGGRHSRPTDYQDGQVRALADRMGVSGIKTYLTKNKWITGPFTNVFSRSVVYPEPWLKFPRLERLAIFAHEFTHDLTKWKFAREMALVLAASVVFPYALFFFARLGIPVIAEVGEFALAVFGISQVSWRNEYRADLGAANAVGAEAMIAVLEMLQSHASWDGSSLTHPPLSSRIKRLKKLLDSAE